VSSPDDAFTLVEHYFRDVPDYSKGKMGPGQLCWAPSLFLLETLTTLKVEYVRQGDEGNVLLKLLTTV